jgi:hypothetical protein
MTIYLLIGIDYDPTDEDAQDGEHILVTWYGGKHHAYSQMALANQHAREQKSTIVFYIKEIELPEQE